MNRVIEFLVTVCGTDWRELSFDKRMLLIQASLYKDGLHIEGKPNGQGYMVHRIDADWWDWRPTFKLTIEWIINELETQYETTRHHRDSAH